MRTKPFVAIAWLLILSTLSGCSPVILASNLGFEAYDPPPYYVTVETTNTTTDLDYDSYNVEGTDAFYFLPYHGNSPAHVFDFQLYDCTNDGTFVYAYSAYYYGNAASADSDISSTNAEIGLTTEDTTRKSGDTSIYTGIAPEPVTKSAAMLTSTICSKLTDVDDADEPTGIVTVMMSYNPESYEYRVFNVFLDDLSIIQASVSATDTGLDDDSNYTTVDTGLIGHKLYDKDEYFIIKGFMGYVYALDGTLVTSQNYYTVIISELTSNNVSYSDYDLELLDAVMDGSYFAYLSVLVSDGSAVITESTSDAGPDAKYYLLSYYNLPLSTEEWSKTTDFIFKSSDLTMDTKVKAWTDIDGKTYDSEADMNAALSLYSEENILASYGTAFEAYHFGNIILSGMDSDSTYEAVGTIDYSLFTGSNLYKYSYLNYSTYYSSNNWSSAYGNQLFYLANNNSYSYYQKYVTIDESFRRSVPYSTLDIYPTYYWFDYTSYIYLDFFYYNLVEPWVLTSGNDSIEGVGPTACYTFSTVKTPTGTDIFGNVISYVTETICTPNDACYTHSLPFSDARVLMVADGITSPKYLALNFPGLNHSSTGAIMPNYPVATPSTLFSEYSTAATYERTVSYEETDEEGTVIASGSTTETWEPIVSWQLKTSYEGYLTWADLRETSEYALPSKDLGAYYYAPSTSGTTSYISYNDGTADRLSDSDITGSAISAQLYYGDTKEICAVLTEQGVQYYSRTMTDTSASANAYTEGSFLPLSSYTPNADVSYTLPGAALTQEETEYFSGEGSSIYSLDQLSMLNDSEMIVATLSSGLMLHNLSKDLFVTLQEGAYFQTFAHSDSSSTSANGNYTVVGFNSTDYAYNSRDIVWAKCYTMDLAETSSDLRDSIITTYLDTLFNLYIRYTHATELDSFGNLLVSSPTTDQTTIINRGEALFNSTEAAMTKELYDILGSTGFLDSKGNPTISDEALAYAGTLRTKMQTQIAQSKALFDMLSVVYSPFVTTSVPLYLQLEESLYYTNYTQQLESILISLFLTINTGISTTTDINSVTGYPVTSSTVSYWYSLFSTTQPINTVNTMSLSDFAALESTDTRVIAFAKTMTNLASTYGYTSAYADDDGNIDVTAYMLVMQSLDAVLSTTTDDSTYTSGSTQYTSEQIDSSIAYSEAYQDLLAFITAIHTHWNSTNEWDDDTLSAHCDDWDEFISTALTNASPFNAQDTALNAGYALYELIGVTANEAQAIQLVQDLSGVYTALGVEQALVDILMSSATYQGTTTAQDWADYQTYLLSNSDSDGAVFYEGDFYGVLEGRQIIYVKTNTNASSQTWTEYLETLLQNCTGGFVWLSS